MSRCDDKPLTSPWSAGSPGSQQLKDAGFWAKAVVGWFWLRGHRSKTGCSRLQSAVRFLFEMEKEEAWSVQRPHVEPEAAQQSRQVCVDIGVRVVYSTVASTQWSKRQVRDIIQMVQYSYSTTSIHQLYIVRFFSVCIFFFSFVMFSRVLGF